MVTSLIVIPIHEAGPIQSVVAVLEFSHEVELVYNCLVRVATWLNMGLAEVVVAPSTHAPGCRKLTILNFRESLLIRGTSFGLDSLIISWLADVCSTR